MATDKDRVGFGIVGLGIGVSRCEMMQEAPEARLVAVADLIEEKARRASGQFDAAWYTDYRKMLERDDIDVIGVYTQSGLHMDVALDAARAGKHVLTTKPMEITLDRIDQIIDTCKAEGVKLTSEFANRYKPANYGLYCAIQQGQFDKLVLGDFAFKCYRNQEYYEADDGWRGTWNMDGGGAIMNQTIHSVDQMRWLMGEVDTVTARWGTYTHDIETEDTAAALVTFKNGAIGTLIGTTTFHNNRPFLRYGGGVTQRIEVNGASGSATLIDNKTAMWKTLGEEEAPPKISSPALNVFQDVARWVQDDSYTSPTLVKVEESRKAVELILAIYESAREGKTVSIGEGK